MKLVGLLLAVFVISCKAQGISTKDINPGFPTRIYISMDTETVIQFPKQFNGVYGKGFVSDESQKEAVVFGKFFSDKPILILHALKPNIRMDMTVYMSGKLWPFKVISGQNPDTQLTLLEGDTPAEVVSPKEVIASRVKYDPELLVSLKDRALGAMFLRKADPGQYQRYESRKCNYDRDDGILKTVVTKVHKFPLEDAIVLEGEIRNLTDQPFVLHQNKIIVMADEGRYAPALTSCNNWQPIPSHSTVPFLVEILGNSHGGRVDLAINNEFRLAIETGAGPIQSPSPTPKATPAP